MDRLRAVVVALSVTLGAPLFAALVMPSTAAAQVPQGQIINRVVFENNKKVNDDILTQGIESKPRTAYNETTVRADVERLREASARAGRASVAITYRVVPLPNNTVDLVFTVNEGEKIGVQEIVFIGNNAFSAWRLKRQMATVETGWLGFLRTTDTYDPDRISSDEDRLRRFYNNRGYPDFRVVSVVPTLNEAQDAYIITFTLEEGQYHTFGQATVQSAIPEVNSDELSGDIRTSAGSTFDAEDVDKTVEDMTDTLSGSGYPFAQVRPRGDRAADGSINVTYVVEEGARVYIERINIRGNTRTRDYVIRREFDVAEGDPYNKAMIDRAVRRLRRLGYFETVRVTNEPGSSPDRVVVNVDVVDQSTGEFSVGGGYATNDGFIGEVALSERNFLGRGQYVRVAAQYGQRTQGFQFSFTEPYFLGQRIAAGFDLFHKTTDAGDYSYYDNRQSGGTLRAAFPITDEFSIGVRYTAYSQDVSIPNENYRDCIYNGVNANFPECLDNGEASIAIKEIQGTRWVSLLGYTLAYNSLDDNKVPSEGILATFKQDVAGLGGDSNFFRTTFDGRYYYPISDDLTLMVRGQAGHMMAWGGKDLYVIDQFNLGPDLVRGFAPSGIGPRDLAGGSKGNALGGTIYYGGTVELQFPILGLPRELGLRGALFADAGTLYDYGGKDYAEEFGEDAFRLFDSSAIRSSVGASLLWASPLGPLRFDYAYVLSEAEHDRQQAFRFSGGTSF